MGKRGKTWVRGEEHGKPRPPSGRPHDRLKIVTLSLDMASDFEKWVLEETLTAEMAGWLLRVDYFDVEIVSG